MTLNYSQHKNILLKILKDIFSSSKIAPFLGFKGGTAALMFYGLDRNSVDIDLDLLDKSREGEILQEVKNIAQNYGEVVEARIKRFNIIIVVSYSKEFQNIKIEINRRDFGSKYELRNILGVPMLVMVREDMFANKLLAMSERMNKTSRDIYDVYFFANNSWPINRELIKNRSGMDMKEVLEKCIGLLENFDNRKILTGLGELLNQSKKDWVKAKLKSETLFFLRLMLEGEKDTRFKT
jgi:predicted nucleotidyltransferase component of viral defense system